MKTSEFLGKARDILAKGWCQYDYAEEGSVCAYGALYAAEGHQVQSPSWFAGEDSELVVSAVAALNEKIKDVGGTGSVISFNDQPTTTQQDMLNLFDKAIIGLEEVGN